MSIKNINLLQTEIRRIISFILIFMISAVLISIPILFSGYNPLEVYSTLLYGGFGNTASIIRTINKTTPLLFCSLGILVAFRCGIWNIGAEGQLYMGALGAAIAGLFIKDIPYPIHIIIVILTSFLGGALWAGIAAMLRVKYKANEIIVTLLMNFIAFWIVFYMVRFPLRPETAFNPVTAQIANTAKLPILIANTSLHSGILIAFVVALIIWIGLKKTVFGYKIKATGSNPEAALYGGISINKIIFFSMFLSGGIAGLAGMSEVSGIHYLLSENVSSNYGYIAIPVALIGRLNPIATVLASIFLGGLLTGGRFIQVVLGIPSTIVIMLVAVFILAFQLEPYIDKKLGLFINKIKNRAE